MLGVLVMCTVSYGALFGGEAAGVAGRGASDQTLIAAPPGRLRPKVQVLKQQYDAVVARIASLDVQIRRASEKGDAARFQELRAERTKEVQRLKDIAKAISAER